MSDTDEAVQAFRAALDSGVKLSRLRVLRVVCGHGRTLAEVFRVNGHDLLVTRATHWRPRPPDPPAWAPPPTDPVFTPMPGQARRRDAARTVVDLAAADDLVELHMSSRCCAHAVTAGWIRHRLAEEHRRRVVLRQSTVE